MLDFITELAVNLWDTLGQMAPYLLFGFLVAGVLSVFLSAAFVERHLSGRGFWPLFKASAFGVPLPLCSCGVIPVAMSLRRHRASRGAVISFLLSTPQTGVDSIAVTYSLLGPVMAVYRPVVALITGLLGGSATAVLGSGKFDDEQEAGCEDDCCKDILKKKNRLRRIFRHGFYTLPKDIGKSMIVGLVIAAFLGAVVPDDFFAEKIGTGIGAMLLMMLAGIPVYVCATASIPIAAVLLAKGLSPGAIMVFLMTGPATNAATITTIWKVLGSRTMFVYLGTVVVCALGSGLVLDYFAFEMVVRTASGGHQMLPAIVKHVSAVLLIVVLGYPLIKSRDQA